MNKTSAEVEGGTRNALYLIKLLCLLDDAIKQLSLLGVKLIFSI